MVSRSSLLRRAGLVFGLSFLLGASAILVLTRGEAGPTLASEGAARGAAWTPAPLLALLIVAGMSGLVLLVSLQPRRS